MTFVTRFAPSPTGPLHIGHAYSAILAHDMARAEGGRFLLRVEDIDQARARPEWEQAIYDDLTWLGLTWDGPVMRQSDRMAVYKTALAQLWDRDLLFGCTCNRRDIVAAASAPHEGDPPMGPDGVIYPGTCHGKHVPPLIETPPGDMAIRLSCGMLALTRAFDPRVDEGTFAGFMETGSGPDGQTGMTEFTPEDFETGIGDIVLARRDLGTSYHLSVVLDDADQGVTHVIRGEDLFEATKIHVVLQRLMYLPTPIYHHHRLIRDGAGKRLAKRDDARSIASYRADGATPCDIRKLVGL